MVIEENRESMALLWDAITKLRRLSREKASLGRDLLGSTLAGELDLTNPKQQTSCRQCPITLKVESELTI